MARQLPHQWHNYGSHCLEAEETKCTLPQILLFGGTLGLKVKCYATEWLIMPKQVGNQSSKRLLRSATFGSFRKLYHTQFCVCYSSVIKYFWWGCSASPFPLCYAISKSGIQSCFCQTAFWTTQWSAISSCQFKQLSAKKNWKWTI